MKSQVSKLFLVVLALLCASGTFAATVTITPSTANPTIGTQFTLTVSGAGFPDTVGATLKLNFDPAVVQVLSPPGTAGIVLAPGSPFTGGISYNGSTPFAPLNNFSVLSPTVGTLPTGSFDAFQIIFTAIAAGNANIVLVDDQADFSWTDATTFLAIPVTYTQANVAVGTFAPNISVTDSVVPLNDLAVAFGNVMVGTTSTQTVTVTNVGGASLSIGLIASTNPLAAPFSITNDLCSSQTLALSSSCTFRVQFQPVAGGPFNDGLDIPSNDPDSPAVSVSVSGTGRPNARDDGPIGVIQGVAKVIPVGANDVGFTNPVALALTALPTKGTISAFSPPGPATGMTITYTANIGAVGLDSFVYEMTDSTQARDSATVTVDIGPVPDSVPDPFVFIDQTGVPLNAVITSNTFTVTGINVPTPISVVGGEYSINGGTFTSLAGTVSNGNTVTVLRISAVAPLTATSATLTIGGVADTFTATTGPDTDGDSVVDGIDNCTLVANAVAGNVPGTSIPRYQLDSDHDGYGNACDADLNNSGLVTTGDFGLLRSVLNELASFSPLSAAADLNASGTVTATDFAILRARLNTPPGPPLPPGPSGLHP